MTISLERARELLRLIPHAPVVYDLEDIEKIYGVRFTSEQRTALENIPFSEQTLRECAGTHMLFPGYSFSLVDLCEEQHDFFFRDSRVWIKSEVGALSRAIVPVCWQLLRMSPVPMTIGEIWPKQQKLLNCDEEIPSAALVIFGAILHFQKSGHRLFGECHVRTSSVDPDGTRVVVGGFDDRGFIVGNYYEDARGYSETGLASARKS